MYVCLWIAHDRTKAAVSTSGGTSFVWSRFLFFVSFPWPDWADFCSLYLFIFSCNMRLLQFVFILVFMPSLFTSLVFDVHYIVLCFSERILYWKTSLICFIIQQYLYISYHINIIDVFLQFDKYHNACIYLLIF